MGINITGLTITNNEIIIDYKGGGEPKKSMICNGIDLEGGYASFTNYSFGTTKGTWETNPIITALNDKGWYGAAVPYYWYTKSSGTRGNCDIGIEGWRGSIPNYKGEYLCYKMINQEDKSRSVNIIVSETCGGNCGPSSRDCGNIGKSEMYISTNRNFPNQLCNPTINPSNVWKTPDGDGPPEGLSYYNGPSDKTKCVDYHTANSSYIFDWCSGYYAQFDLDAKLEESFFVKGNNGILKYERINCPNELPPIPPKPNTECDSRKCNSTNYKTNDSCLKAMGGVSRTGEGTCCIITKAWNGTCTLCGGDYTNKSCTT